MNPLEPALLTTLADRHRTTLSRLAAEDHARAGARRRRLARWPGARRRPPRLLPDAALGAVLSGAPGAGPGLGTGRSRTARLLVVRPDHIGDLLFVGPALALLRDRLPDLEMALLVGPWSRLVAERLPGQAAVATLDFPFFNRRAEPPWRRYGRLIAASLRLRRRGPFDAALVLRDDDWASAWLCRLAGIRRVVAHQHPLADLFADFVLPAAQRPAHTAAANLALAGAATGDNHEGYAWDRFPLTFRLGPDDHARAIALLSAHGIGADTRPLAIHPGAGAALKRWNAAAWSEVVRQIAGREELVVLTGSKEEKLLTAAVADALATVMPAGQVVDLAGATDLATLGAVFARCRLVMGPDSGPLHLAAAARTPTVHLYGPADPVRFGPWGAPDRHHLVMSPMGCAPCGRLDWRDVAEHPCVGAISVEAVAMAARSVLGGAG